MAKQTINIGSFANDGTGTNLRSGGTIINDNFNEIYTALGNGTTITLTATPTELNLLSGATAILTPSSSAVLSNKTISGSSNTLSNIGNSSLTNSSFSIRDDSSSAISISLGGTLKLKSNDGITTTVSQGDTITIGLDSNIVTETSSDVLTNKTISASSNTITGLTNTNLSGSAGITNANIANSFIQISDESSTVGSVSLGGRIEFTTGAGIDTLIENGNRVRISTSAIPNASLSNSTITLGSTSTALGATTTSVAGLSLTGSTNTIDLTSSGNKLRFNFANTGVFPNATTYQGQFAVATGVAKAYFADSGAYNEILSENSSIKDLSDVAGTSPTNGQVLTFNSTSGRYEPSTPAGTGTVTSITAGTGLSGGTITSSGTISITNPNIKFSDDTSTVATIDLGNTLNIAGGTGLTSTVSGSSITLNIDSTVATLTGSQILTNKTINSNDNTITNIKAGNLIADGIFQGAATIDVTASGSAAYLFNSHYSGNNPTLYLKAGLTYAFNLQQGGSHPFFLQTVSGAYSAGNAYNIGLTHVSTAGVVTTGAVGPQSSGVLYIEVPSGSSSTIYYVCQNHSGMAGSIVFVPDTVNLSYSSGTATGDGSTTTTTISSGRSVNDILVFVNGFQLTPTTDYTISGTTLTFATAPASSAEITFRYLPIGGAYSHANFTGDGSTTTITIDAGRAVDDILVIVNGLTLVPTDDYTISGTTLTFATAPAASAEITVRYLRLS